MHIFMLYNIFFIKNNFFNHLKSLKIMKKFFAFVAAAFVALTMNAQATDQPQVFTVAEAITEGMALDSAATSEDEYTVEGFVINAQAYSLTYNNQIWYMADAANATESDFQAYGCVALENNDTLQVINGDKVQLTGKLFKYWNKNAGKFIIEIKNGTATFVSKAEGDHSINKTTTAITVAQALEIGKTLALGATTAEQYEITGYVTAMAGKDTDFETYGNQTYWISDTNNGTAASNADGAFEVYRGKASEAVAVGYKVKVKTAIKNYNSGGSSLIESETNAAVTILEKGDAPKPEAITVTEAVSIALALGDNETSTVNYAVAGYVAKVYEEFNTQYNNLSFYMTDDATSTYGDLQCRRAKMSAEEGPTLVAGDKVLIVGKLTNNFYNDKNTAQIYQGQATIEWKTAIENILMNDTKINKVIVDGVLYIVREGKLYTVQGQEVK